MEVKFRVTLHAADQGSSPMLDQPLICALPASFHLSIDIRQRLTTCPNQHIASTASLAHRTSKTVWSHTFNKPSLLQVIALIGSAPQQTSINSQSEVQMMCTVKGHPVSLVES